MCVREFAAELVSACKECYRDPSYAAKERGKGQW